MTDGLNQHVALGFESIIKVSLLSFNVRVCYAIYVIVLV